MNIQAEKIELMKLLLETENPGIIKSIKRIFARAAKHDFWDDLSKEQQEDILLGIQEIENGEYVSYEEFIQKPTLARV